MLLSLQRKDFPVDTNVGRICARLGWIPIEAAQALEVRPWHMNTCTWCTPADGLVHAWDHPASADRYALQAGIVCWSSSVQKAHCNQAASRQGDMRMSWSWHAWSQGHQCQTNEGKVAKCEHAEQPLSSREAGSSTPAQSQGLQSL